MPGIGQLRGKSFGRTPYLFCAFAGIRFWSTVPAFAATVFSLFISRGRIIGADSLDGHGYRR
jgi:hypothetical protein